MYTINIDLIYTANYIIQNSWEIQVNTIDTNIYSITNPGNIYVNTKYIYTIEYNNVIEEIIPIFNNNSIVFSTNALIPVNTITFNMYYVSELSIQQPYVYIKSLITFDDNIQYIQDVNLYIKPYTKTGENLNKYLYTFTIQDDFTDKTINSIIILNDMINIDSIIFQQDNNRFIISIDTQLDNNIYTIIVNNTNDTNDTIDHYTVSITYYQDAFNIIEYSSQISMNQLYAYTNDINIYNITNNTNDADYYLVSYTNFEINNLSLEPFKQVDIMKPNITVETTPPTITIPEFKNPTKIFEYIRLYIDDMMIEEINQYTLETIYNVYEPVNRKRQLDKLIEIRFQGDKWTCILPLSFWFNYKEGCSIPLVALRNSKICIKYKLNKIENILSNLNTNSNIMFSHEPTIKISLLSDTILLDTDERKLFASYSHEYMITVFRTYGSTYINSLNTTINTRLKGLIKDIILVSKPVNNDTTYFQEIINNYEIKYQYYLDATNYYNQFLKDNYITSVDQEQYIYDFSILENINIEVITQTTDRYKYLSSLYTIYDIKFLLFLQDKYSFSFNTIAMYLKYMFKNNQIINKISPLDTLCITVNGCNLFTSKNHSYFTNVIPYTKFQSSPDVGYYVYTFALYPLSDQPSGHLNFNHFDNVIFNITSNNIVTTENYSLVPITREFNILRIMSGIGALAWI